MITTRTTDQSIDRIRATNRFVICHSSLLIGLLLLGGCTGTTQHAPTSPHPRTATPQYWLDQPATVTLGHHDYDRLWRAAERTIRDYFFTVDRTDYRRGVLTSRPMISRQFFELWRRDTATPPDLIQSSLGTVRRTLHFQIERAPASATSSGGGSGEPADNFVLAPRVVVERLARTELRYTTALQYRGAFMHDPTLAPDTEPGEVPLQYWYAIGRDEALEQRLLWSIERRLR